MTLWFLTGVDEWQEMFHKKRRVYEKIANK